MVEIGGHKVLGAFNFNDFSSISNLFGFGSSLASLFPGVGTVLGAGLGLGSSILNSVVQNRQSELDEDRYNKSFEYQKQLNDQAYQLALQNFELQQDVYNYEKDLQNTIFDREDSAVQRRALDLEKAGLSKTLAAGSAANAGSAINVSAPQNIYNPNEISVFSALMDAYNQSRQVSSLMSLQEAQTSQALAEARKLNAEAHTEEETGVKSVLTDIMYKNSSIDLNKKQLDYINSQIDKINVDISYTNTNIKKILSEIGLNNIEADKMLTEINYITSQSALNNSLTENEQAKLKGILLNNIKTSFEIQSTKLSNEEKRYSLDKWRSLDLPVLNMIPSVTYQVHGLSFGASYTGPVASGLTKIDLASFFDKFFNMTSSDVDRAWQVVKKDDFSFDNGSSSKSLLDEIYKNNSHVYKKPWWQPW